MLFVIGSLSSISANVLGADEHIRLETLFEGQRVSLLRKY